MPWLKGRHGCDWWRSGDLRWIGDTFSISKTEQVRCPVSWGDFEPENYRIQGGSPHRRFGKREMNTISIVTIACDMWTNMK